MLARPLCDVCFVVWGRGVWKVGRGWVVCGWMGVWRGW